MRNLFRIIFGVIVSIAFMVAVAALITRVPANTAPTAAHNAINAQIAYPEPGTPTGIINTPTPISSATPYPTASPFPTIYPTAIGELPTGEKIVYAELRQDEINIWAVSIADVTQRKKVYTIKRTSRGGVRFSISPDATKLAYTQFPVDADVNNPFQADLWVVDLKNGSQSKIASSVDIGRYRNYPVWSPNSRSLAVMRRQEYGTYYVDTALVVDVETKQEVSVVESKIATPQEAATQAIYILDWSQDGSNLYFQRGLTEKVELWRVAIDTIASSRVAPIASSGTPRCYNLSPDRSLLLCAIFRVNATGEFATSIVVIPTSGEEATTLDIPVTSDPIWGGNSAAIAVANNANLLVLENKNATPMVYQAKKTTLIEALGWSTNGDWFAVYTAPETRGGLTLINYATQEELIVAPTDGSEFIGWMPLIQK